MSIPHPLSRREWEILGLLCGGLSAPEVAGELGLSVGVVKNKRRTIYQKLHVSALAEACDASQALADLRHPPGPVSQP